MKTLFRGTFVPTMLFTTMLSASVVHAELLSVDLICESGDGQLTRDTATNTDWLDVTLTTNQTYDQVRTGVYYKQGFHHATKAELEILFINAGIPDDGFDIGLTHPNEALALISLLGSTTSGSMNTIGFTGSDYFGNTVTTANYPIGTQFSALLGKIQYIDLRSSGLGLIGEANFAGGHPFSDEADPNYGSFLVRSSILSDNSKCKKDKDKDKDKNPE